MRKKRAASRAPIPSSPKRFKKPQTLDDAAGLSLIPSSQGRLKTPGLSSCHCSAQITTPYRVAKRKSLHLLACSSAQIQIPCWGAKRARTSKSYHLLACSSGQVQIPYWGAKRARTGTALGGRRRNGYSLPPPNKWRDWANLDDGPVGLISERVLASDVADYVRFRAVCHPWRRCCANPRAYGVLDRRFHPWRWIMLREERSVRNAPSRHRFLNVFTGQCVTVDLPQFRDHRLLQSGIEGLLFLLDESTGVISLLNPLMCQVSELPPITSIGSNIIGDLADNAGLADDRTVLLYFYRIATLAFAKPGDKHWVLLKIDELLMPTISFAGRFYGVTDHDVVAVETRENLPPRLVVVAELAERFSRMADTMHLVDNGGELILVHRKLCRVHGDNDKRTYKYKVYRVDLDAGKMTRAYGLRGRAVFIDESRAFSVPSRAFSCISADTVYPGFNCAERSGYPQIEQIAAYHLTDGSIEPSNYERQHGLARPLSIADFLAIYV